MLELIAERTGKPLSYFVLSDSPDPRGADPDDSLTRQLSAVATRVRRFGTRTKLNKSEREAVKLLELTLRQAVVLMSTIEARYGG